MKNRRLSSLLSTFFLIVALVAVTGFALAEAPGGSTGTTASGPSNEDISFGDEHCSGTLTGVNYDLYATVSLPEDMKFYDYYTWGIKISITTKVSGNFDVSVTDPASTDNPYQYNIKHEEKSEDFFLNLTRDISAVVASEVPAHMQGTFSDSFVFGFTWHFFGGFPTPQVQHTPEYTFDSIEPADDTAPGKHFNAYFGTANTVDLSGVTYEPLFENLLSGGYDFHSGITARADLHKNEWGSGQLPADTVECIHSCAEDGKEGCLEGRCEISKQYGAGIWAQIYCPLFDWQIMDKTEIIGGESDTETTDMGHFVQSLTFREPFQYKDFCDHLYYRVPVAVWMDHDKTIPAKGVYVYADKVKSDPNIIQLSHGITGSNQTIEGDGRINLYLPWKDGKYTVIMDPDRSDPKYREMSGSADQPSAMKRGGNDQVDIILSSQEQVVYTAEKHWDIDLEYQDKPDSVDVVLQARYSNTTDGSWTTVETGTVDGSDLTHPWKYVFQPVSRYELLPDGSLREIPYRVRELEEKKGNEADGNDEERKAVENWVEYTVPAYVTLAGEPVSRHRTRYMVTYEEQTSEDQVTVSITNTAVLDFTLPKIWVGFDDDTKKPDYVFLALCYRVNSKYLDRLPDNQYKRLAETWIPVLNPIRGDMVGLLTVLDLDWIKSVDPTGIARKLQIPMTIGRARKPLWTLRFTTRKYGWTVVPGIPVEFRAMEVSSDVITDLVKLLTGYDIPLGPSVNPGSGKVYVSTPITPRPLPGLNRDWDRYGSVINTAIPSGGTAIGGAKYWANDTEADRPEKLYIHVKDRDSAGQETEINKEPVELKRSDFEGSDIWYWTLDSSQVKEGVTLDPDKTYIVSETFPDGYTSPYTCEVDGHDLINTKGKTLRLIVNIAYQPEASFTFGIGTEVDIKNKQGENIGRGKYREDYPSKGPITLVDGDQGVQLKGQDLDHLNITGRVLDGTVFSGQWITEISDADRSEDSQYITYTYTVLNRKQPRAVLELKKEWDEGGAIPDQVNVTLKRKAGETGTPEELGTVTLEASEGWKKTVTSYRKEGQDYTLWRYDENGNEYIYFIEEAIPEGYQDTIETTTTEDQDTGDLTWHFTITNTLAFTIKGTITWDDEGSAQLRPGTVRLRLMTPDGPALDDQGHYIDQTVDRTVAENTWPYTFEKKVPGYAKGQLIQYSVIEFQKDADKPLDHYTVSYDEPRSDTVNHIWTCDLVNSTRAINIAVEKEWDDDGDAYGERPDSVTVRLMKKVGSGDYEEAGRAELNKEGGWCYAFKNLPVREGESSISYTITEDAVPGYTTKIDPEPERTNGQSAAEFDKQPTAYRITNTLDRTKMNIPVIKVWANDRPEDRPDSVAVNLYRVGENEASPVATMQLTAANGWKGTFTVPRKSEDEKRTYEYYLQETVFPGTSNYTSFITPASISGSDTSGKGFTVTNTYQTFSIPVTKIWVEDAETAATHTGITVTLYQNETAYRTLKLTKDGSWTGTFSDLPRRDADGEVFRYTLQEETLANYRQVVTPAQISGDDTSGAGFTVTNILLGKIRVRKVWDDANDHERNRPDAITVWLTEDGRDVGYSVLKPPEPGADQWYGLFENVPLYRRTVGGVAPISYWVREDPLTGYECVVQEETPAGQAHERSFVLTNTPEKISVTIRKSWEDGGYEGRPSSVTVHLYDEHERIGTYVLTANTEPYPNWTVTIDNLPVYRNGRKIRYRATEDVPPRYRMVVYGSAEVGFTITNVLLPIEADITVEKIWPDETSEKPTITVRLLSDKDKAGSMKEVAYVQMPLTGSETPWMHIFQDQPVYTDDYRLIRYSVTEEGSGPEYLPPLIGRLGDYHFVIVNRLANRTNVLVSKVWNDGENAFDTRPEEVTVELYNNRTAGPVGEPIKLRERLWIGGFFSLPRVTESGEKIAYSVREKDVDRYSTHIIETGTPDAKGAGPFTFRVTNTLRCLITYDPNGGTIDGSGEPVEEKHLFGEEIKIRSAPVRSGYRFLYWQGSEYQPGDSYTVTGDHTFVAQWELNPEPPPEPLNYRFTFTKKWSGDVGDGISWTLYNPDGSVRHKKFNKTVVSDTEWRYDAWFASPEEYYLIEDVPAGYRVRYENVGAHAGETDRLYNGGTVYNYKIPKTGDRSGLPLWTGMTLLGIGVLGWALAMRRRARKKML